MTEPATESHAIRPQAGLGAVASGLTLAALPVFMIGGLAVQIRADLGFTETQLGAAVTAAFLLAAAAGPLGGRLADAWGPRRAILAGAALTVVALAGIGGFAQSYLHLAGLLAVAGMSFVFMDPGLAVLVTRTMPPHRHGLAFGIKEASVPVATLAAGLAVPAIALTLGWRWAFLLGLIPLSTLLWLLSRIDLSGNAIFLVASVERTAPPRSAVRVVAVAAALASTGASGIGVFLTESAVAMGLSPAGAGYLLATGSVAGIITRVGTGIWADRTGGTQLRLMTIMLTVGAVAMAVAALGSGPLLVLGTIGTFTGAWGWSGLLFLSLVRSSPASPGAVAGIGLTGLAVGNALGPLIFGATAENVSFPAAWLVAATLVGAGAVVLHRVRPRFG